MDDSNALPNDFDLDFSSQTLLNEETDNLIEAARVRKLPLNLEFKGNATEFFQIWIVNMMFTLITLGIYNAWAKVRERKYFYNNTLLDGHPFDYHGNPTSILKGNILVGGGYLLYQFFSQTQRYTALAILAIAATILFPVMIYSSLRFSAFNSSYKNVRFNFFGRVGQSYFVYGLLSLASLLPYILAGIVIYLRVDRVGFEASNSTAVLEIAAIAVPAVLIGATLSPWIKFMQRKYVYSNAGFGSAKAIFTPKLGRFYNTYINSFLISLGAYAMLGGMMFLGGKSSLVSNFSGMSDGNALPGASFVIQIIIIYFALIFLGTFIQQFISVGLARHSWESLRVGELSFRSTMKTRAMTLMAIGNILAIIFTGGLAIPWARLRTNRYILENLEVYSDGNLESFTSEQERHLEGSIGDAAADFFNIDIAF